MKVFCQIPGCNQETQGKSCSLCGVHVCQDHGRMISLSFDPQDFWAVRSALEVCMSYCCDQIRFLSYAAVFDTYASPHTESKTIHSLETYRNFYERVVPHVKFPENVESGKVFCMACLKKLMDSLNRRLNTDFYPVLKAVKHNGLICQAYGECLFDVVKVKNEIWRCGDCGKYCCYRHAACCYKCKKTLCVGSVSDGGWDDWSEAHGGCAEKHSCGFFNRSEKHIGKKI